MQQVRGAQQAQAQALQQVRDAQQAQAQALQRVEHQQAQAQALQQQAQALQQQAQALQQQAQAQGEAMPRELQALQVQLRVNDANAHARVLNSRLNPPEVITWLQDSSGALPAQDPMQLAQLQAASGAATDALLGHYGLETRGTVQERRARLLRHLGVPA
jgi:exonuclease VII large subunit